MFAQNWEKYWSQEKDIEWWKKPAPEVINFIRSLSIEKHRQVLDFGCGLGRHSVALARAGFDVWAIDGSMKAVKHTREWAESLNLPIKTKSCDLMNTELQDGFFDAVISYNEICKGYREKFEMMVEHIHSLLRLGGYFFFTCPGREDGKYGFGEEVAPHTYRCDSTVSHGDIFYFADENDFEHLLKDFNILEKDKEEGFWLNNGFQQFYSNWRIKAGKK